MNTSKSILTTETTFSDDRKHRYLLKKEWDGQKRKAMIIMINPGSANEVSIDHTTMYVLNNLDRLGYGSVDILNIFSLLDKSISSAIDKSLATNEENDGQILASAEKADDIIIAWGKSGEIYKVVKERQLEVLELLRKYKDKIYTLEDNLGNSGFHPLAPQIRFHWILRPFDIEKYLQDAQNSGKAKDVVPAQKQKAQSKSSLTSPEEKKAPQTSTVTKLVTEKSTRPKAPKGGKK